MKKKVKCAFGLLILSFLGCNTSTDGVMEAKISAIQLKLDKCSNHSSSSSRNYFSKKNHTTSTSEQIEISSFPKEKNLFGNGFVLTDFMKQFIPKEELFLLDPSKDTSVFSKGGTRLTIGKGSFVTNSDVPVLTLVQLKLREYRDMASLVSSNITTQSEYGELVSTEGVMHFSAFSKDAEVYLRHGKSIQVAYPCSGNYSKIWLFEGAMDNSDCIQWSKLNKVLYPKSKHKTTHSELDMEVKSIEVKDEDRKTIYKKDNSLESSIGKEKQDSVMISVSIDKNNRILSEEGWVVSTNEKIKPTIVSLKDNFLSNHRRSRILQVNDELPIREGFGISVQVNGLTHFIVVDLDRSRKRISKVTNNKDLTFTITGIYSGQALVHDKNTMLNSGKVGSFSISSLGWYSLAARKYKNVANKVISIEDTIFNGSRIYLVGKKDKTIRIAKKINNHFEYLSNPNEAVLIAIKERDGKSLVYFQTLSQTNQPFIASEDFKELTMDEFVSKLNSDN